MTHPGTTARRLLGATVLFGTAWLWAACAAPQVDDEPVAREPAPQRERFGNLDRQRLVAEGVDLSLDGTPDQWRFTDSSGRLVMVERDLNFDGQIDVREYFAPDGTMIEREFVLDASGRVTSVQFFSEGRLQRRELLVGREGDLPIVLHYDEDGKLVRTERDSAQRGRVDLWEYYEEGQLVRVGFDSTGDGRPNRFEDVR